MANYLRPAAQIMAATGTTGNSAATDGGVEIRLVGDAGFPQIAFQFVVEVAGATPTVTFKYQGSLDRLTWSDVAYTTPALAASSQATQAVVATGTTVNFLADARLIYRYYRCVTTANTNITYRAEAYAWLF